MFILNAIINIGGNQKAAVPVGLLDNIAYIKTSKVTQSGQREIRARLSLILGLLNSK